jgi:hypothetical protein
MNTKTLFFSFLLLYVFGCAAYKELEPEPAIKFFENDYIELKEDDEYFELDKDDKYFIKFPSALKSDIYLVLEIYPKAAISSYLTDRFDDGKGFIKKIPDMTPDSETHLVYALDQSALNYYWVIESVYSDLTLECKYRFIAKWRYDFEKYYVELQDKFESNKVKRDIYNSLGTDIHSSQIALDQELQNLKTKSANLNTITSSLPKLENILPKNIKDSNDKAFLDFLQLQNDLNEEIDFQKKYKAILTILKLEKESKGDPEKIANVISDINTFYKSSNPENVETEVTNLLGPQLQGVVSYFDRKLTQKNDKSKINLDAKGLEEIYGHTGKTVPSELKSISKFIENFNKRANALEEVAQELKQLKSEVKSANSWPSNSYYTSVKSKLAKIRSKLPDRGSSTSFDKYSNSKSAKKLNSAISDLNNEISQLSRDYEKATELVTRINRYKQSSNYRDIIKILKENSRLSFLLAQYSNVDELSLNQQKNSILSNLRQNRFAEVESGLRSLFNDNYFLNLSSAQRVKNELIKSTEDTVMSMISRQSIKRANNFINENYLKTNTVDQFYTNPAFSPVHELTFTSGSTQKLNNYKQGLNKNLFDLKTKDFPEKAIEGLYNLFTKDINSFGVQRARAIVIHGNNYTGTKNQIKNLVAECDPFASKWIINAKSYRKIYALPTTTNVSGENEYLFKFNIKIASDARFPVFDINIKLPKEVAQNAGTKQWYESITMNGKVLKNEGRFSIVAPSADNNYECQITPVQMEKDADNILEVKFKHPTFKVFEISAMAQKPIIKKN